MPKDDAANSPSTTCSAGDCQFHQMQASEGYAVLALEVPSVAASQARAYRPLRTGHCSIHWGPDQPSRLIIPINPDVEL